MSDWVNCPICGSPDMRRTESAEGDALIFCVNHECASNGGTNSDALVPEVAPFAWSTKPPTVPGYYWLSLDGIEGSIGVAHVYQGLYDLWWTYQGHTPTQVKATKGRWAGPIALPIEETQS